MLAYAYMVYVFDIDRGVSELYHVGGALLFMIATYMQGI